MPLRGGRFDGAADVAAFVEDFHALHEESSPSATRLADRDA